MNEGFKLVFDPSEEEVVTLFLRDGSELRFNNVEGIIVHNPDEFQCPECEEQQEVEEPPAMEEPKRKRKKTTRRAKRWTSAEESHLLKLYHDGHPNRQIARTLGRTLAATEARLSNLRKKGRVKKRN